MLIKKVLIYGSVFHGFKRNHAENLFISISQPNEIGYLAYEKLSPSGKYSLLITAATGLLIVHVSSNHQLMNNTRSCLDTSQFLISAVVLEPDVTSLNVNLNILTTLSAINLGLNSDGYFDQYPDVDDVRTANFKLAKTFWDELREESK